MLGRYVSCFNRIHQVRGVLVSSLGAAGIRSIEYDARAQAFRLITGAAPNRENINFKLWNWSGEVDQPQLHEIDKFDYSLKPEGVTRVNIGGRSFNFIVFDTSGYYALE